MDNNVSPVRCEKLQKVYELVLSVASRTAPLGSELTRLGDPALSSAYGELEYALLGMKLRLSQLLEKCR
ncbi:hypothetical protein Pogu_2107 [Pyrobaculum oguniense TE7]|uniref:Uncharacterized protein n=1 Tax=Pyrobaculum oguniense (strain DSM 13380 / JCM 10595 / TE7) TaxID=698757 RepID=H6QCT8_PYROT|nr:hypothetical protein Pogu_2107 [Pyrobaculum oguniense TE7]